MYLKRLKESVEWSVFEKARPVRSLLRTSNEYGPFLPSPHEKKIKLTTPAATKLIQRLFNVILNLYETSLENRRYEEKVKI
jgi:hypothetical protein